MADEGNEDPFGEMSASQLGRRGRSANRSKSRSARSLSSGRVVNDPTGEKKLGLAKGNPSASTAASAKGKRQRADSQECIICAKAHNGDAINCVVCLENVCKECSTIPEPSWLCVKNKMIPGCSWSCNYCQKSGLPSLRGFTDMIGSMKSDNKDLLEKLTEKMSSIDDRMGSIEDGIERKLDEKLGQLEGRLEDRMGSIEAGIEKKLDERLGLLEVNLDTHINKKLKANTEGLMSELEDRVSTNLGDKIARDLALSREEDTRAVMRLEEKFTEMADKVRQLQSPDSIKKAVVKAIKEKCEEKVEDMSDHIKTVVNTQIQAAAGKSQTLKSTATSPGTQVRMAVTQMTGEMEERYRKRKNIVLFGLKEPGTNIKDDRIREDKTTLGEIVVDILGVQLDKEDMIGMQRLGRLPANPETAGTRPTIRPLLVTLPSEEKKVEIFRNLPKLKGSKYDHLTVKYDMTVMEREKNRSLVARAVELEKEDRSGKYHYKVRGPPWERKIIKIMVRKPEKDKIEGGQQEVNMEIEKEELPKTNTGQEVAGLVPAKEGAKN